ncbi:MAG: hypothetical protein RQ760_07575 [Sedimentisphaerales bacterium]|nr:hypothetical protein [Sedimentisphaerales bacterium]
MQKTETRKAKKEPKTVQGLLLSALDMEDEIAHSVYRDYLDRENWPVDLKDDIFEEIQKYLTTLLDDTERHRKIIRNLQSKLGQNDG